MNDSTITNGPWTINDYARHWKVSRATVYTWINKGWLTSVKIGAIRRIQLEDHQEFRKRVSRGAY